MRKRGLIISLLLSLSPSPASHAGTKIKSIRTNVIEIRASFPQAGGTSLEIPSRIHQTFVLVRVWPTHEINEKNAALRVLGTSPHVSCDIRPLGSSTQDWPDMYSQDFAIVFEHLSFSFRDQCLIEASYGVNRTELIEINRWEADI